MKKIIKNRSNPFRIFAERSIKLVIDIGKIDCASVILSKWTYKNAVVNNVNRHNVTICLVFNIF